MLKNYKKTVVPIKRAIKKPAAIIKKLEMTKQEIFARSLLKVRNILKVPFWLYCGTALGFYRGGKFIEHDGDIDIGIMIRDYDQSLIDTFKKSGFTFLHQYGTSDNGLKLSFRWNQESAPKIDIFFVYEEDNYYWDSYYEAKNWVVNKGIGEPKQMCLKYTKYRRISVEFLGVQFHVPEITYIEELYGENWRILNKNWVATAGVHPQELSNAPFHNLVHIWQNNVTIGIKTFLRPECLHNCLKSIRLYYPMIGIVVTDDSDDAIIKRNREIALEFNAQIITASFDIGVSAGRNLLLDHIHTKYMILIDDDTIFTYQTDIQKMYYFLEETDYDIIGGIIPQRGFFNATFLKYTLEPKILYFNEKHGGSIYNSSLEAFKTDRCMNCFMAKTESIRKVKWNEKYKNCEHTLFFIDAWKQGLKIALTKQIIFNEKHINSDTYNKYRYRTEEYKKIYENDPKTFKLQLLQTKLN